MIKVMWRAFKVKVLFEKEIGNWETKYRTAEDILKSLEYDLGCKIKQKILEQIDIEYDKEIVNKLAKQFVDSYDIEKTVKEVVQDKFKQYVSGVVQQDNNYILAQQQRYLR